LGYVSAAWENLMMAASKRQAQNNPDESRKIAPPCVTVEKAQKSKTAAEVRPEGAAAPKKKQRQAQP
jgi:hypothetical protein